MSGRAESIAAKAADPSPAVTSSATSDGELPAYGVLSWLQKDNLYWFGDRGFLYTTPWVVTARTVRYQAMLLLTASHAPFELCVAGTTQSMTAATLAPLTPRGLSARNVGQISLHVGPDHPAFPAFRRIPQPGVLALDRDLFRPFDEDLLRAYEGGLAHHEAARLFERLVAETVAQLPPSGPEDPRAARALALVKGSPGIRLSEVARRLDVSYTTASELVSEAIGLPLRAYRYAQKCEHAARRLVSDAPLTRLALEAGFTDSAHMTRSWQRRFGHPPSYTRDERHVRVVARKGSSPLPAR